MDGTIEYNKSAVDILLSNTTQIIKRFYSQNEGTSFSFYVSDTGLYRLTVYRGGYVSQYICTFVGGMGYANLYYSTSSNPVSDIEVNYTQINVTVQSWGYIKAVVEKLY